MLGEWGEVEYAERDEARNVVVAFVDDDPHDLKVVLEEVGNDECILHEETEVGVGAPFGGTQLNNGAYYRLRVRSCEILTQCASPFFQCTRKNISTLASHINGNVIRRARYSPAISIKTLQ